MSRALSALAIVRALFSAVGATRAPLGGASVIPRSFGLRDVLRGLGGPSVTLILYIHLIMTVEHLSISFHILLLQSLCAHLKMCIWPRTLPSSELVLRVQLLRAQPLEQLLLSGLDGAGVDLLVLLARKQLHALGSSGHLDRASGLRPLLAVQAVPLALSGSHDLLMVHMRLFKLSGAALRIRQSIQIVRTHLLEAGLRRIVESIVSLLLFLVGVRQPLSCNWAVGFQAVGEGVHLGRA